MWPVLGGLISGGLGLLTNMLGQDKTNQFASEEADKSRAFNSAQVLQQQQFQEQMSSSAYQRASKDMTAAGLNPAAMFGSAGAASTPGGSVATTQPVQKTSALSTIGPSLDRVVSSAISAKTFERMVEEIANLKVTNERIVAETATERERPLAVRAGTGLTSQREITEGYESRVRRNRAVESENEEAFRRTAPGRFLDQSGLAGRKGSETLRPVGDVVNSAGGVVRALRGLSRHNFDMRWAH